MGFWIFMTLSLMLVPGLMMLFGRIFMKNPPSSINGVYGYRTSMSSKNQDTWDFAQKYMGKVWWKTGRIMLVAGIAVMLPVLNKGQDIIGWVGTAGALVECLFMLITVFFVERALRRTFDKDGKRLK